MIHSVKFKQINYIYYQEKAQWQMYAKVDAKCGKSTKQVYLEQFGAV